MVVAPALAAMQGVIPTLGTVPSLELVAGRELAPDELAESLVDLGYVRADVVEHRGEFAVRGGVVDVFPGTARRPVRLEYWGDEIESLREFVPSTQLSTDKVAHVEVPPVRELIPDDALRARAARAARGTRTGSPTGSSASPTGCSSRVRRPWRRSCSIELPTPAELLPEGSWVVVSEAHRTFDRARQAHLEAEALAEAIAWPGARALHPLEEALGDRVQLHLTEFAEGVDLGPRALGDRAGQPAGARRAGWLSSRRRATG